MRGCAGKITKTVGDHDSIIPSQIECCIAQYQRRIGRVRQALRLVKIPLVGQGRGPLRLNGELSVIAVLDALVRWGLNQGGDNQTLPPAVQWCERNKLKRPALKRSNITKDK